MMWLLETALLVLLAATLFHATRLERALGVLKRDRAALEELVSGFNSSTRAAENGIERLREAADGAGRQIARQTEQARALKEDLHFLSERGERLADRLDGLVRAARVIAPEPARAIIRPEPEPQAPASWAAPAPVEREVPAWIGAVGPRREPETLARGGVETAPEAEPKLRSQAERDLLRALRMAR